jgi:hypothetical protein
MKNLFIKKTLTTKHSIEAIIMVIDGWSFVGLTLLNALACVLLPRLISLNGSEAIDNTPSENSAKLGASEALPENG